MPDLPDGAHRLYVVLLACADHPDAAGTGAADLARMTGKSPHEVTGLIDELEKAQLVTVDRRSGGLLVHEVPPAGCSGPSSLDHLPAPQENVVDPQPSEVQSSNQRPKQERSFILDPDGEGGDLDHLEKQVAELCGHLADLVKKNGAKRPKITYAWKDAARGLLVEDDYSFDQVWEGIVYAQEDTFWASMTITMTRLRKHFDQIIVQARKRTQDTSTPQGKQAQQDVVRRRMDRLSEFMEAFEARYGRQMTDGEQKKVMARLKKEVQ